MSAERCSLCVTGAAARERAPRERLRTQLSYEAVSKVWVLDTSTKGTGASVVPLESTLRKPEADVKPRVAAPKKRRAKPQKERAQRPPRRFKVVDLVSSETLAEDTGMRATLDVLEDVRSSVDVQVFVWDHNAQRWDLLRLAERRALWEAAHRAAPTNDP